MIRRRATNKIIFIAVLLMSAAFFFAAYFAGASAPCAIAQSLEEGYLAQTGGEGDWYFSEDYLDIAAARESIRDILESGDLSEIEQDPVVIAVIDTGVQTRHEIFDADGEEDVFLRGENGMILSRNTINNTYDVSDGAEQDFHGTHVTGIVALLIRAFGLSDYIKILPVKAGKYTGSGNTFELSDVEEGVDYALDCGADVVNLSLGSSKFPTNWRDAVTASDAEKAVFVAAAGNYGNSSVTQPFYPAANSYVVGVMNYEQGEDGTAVMHEGEKIGSGSNYGGRYDVCAPGTDILSADGGNMGYKTLTGTSMASPVTAFAVALLTFKLRAEGVYDGAADVSASDVREVFLRTFRESMKYKGRDYPLLSFTGITETSYALDESGEIYLTAVAESAPAASVGSLTLGTETKVTFSAECGYLDAGASFAWSYYSNGLYMRVEGQEVTVGVVAGDIEGFDVTLEISTPDGATKLSEQTFTISTEYLTLTSANSSVTMSRRTDDDGVVRLNGRETVTFGIDTLVYASPDTVTVWYVNGKEAARGDTFEFSPATDGDFTVAVTVDGEEIGSGVRVSASGVEDAKRLIPVIAGVCGGAAALVAVVIVVVLIVRIKARPRTE